MDVVHRRCAGLDISKKDAKVAVRVAGGGRAGTKTTVTTWSSMTGQVLALREHLVAAQVTCVVMEATSDYWKPFYYVLEDGPRGEGDVVADDPELVDCSVPGLVGVAPCVVVRARVAVGGLFGEHVPDRDEHGVLDGDDGLEGSAAGGDAPVLGGEVGALCPGGGHGRDAQGALEVGVGWSGVGGLDPAGGLVGPGAGPGPGGQVAWGCEAGHVRAGLGDDHVGHAGADARDRDDQVPDPTKGCDRLL